MRATDDSFNYKWWDGTEVFLLFCAITIIMAKTKQLTSATMRLGQVMLRMPPSLCGNIVQEVLNKTITALATVPKNLRKARIPYTGDGQESAVIPDCKQCKSLIDHYPETLNRRWIHLTTVTVTFRRGCSLEQLHIVASLSCMPNLRRLALFRVPCPEFVYGQLARRKRFELDYFGCDSDITENLIRFLAGQPQLSECSILARSNRACYKWPLRQHIRKPLSNVTLLQTTAPLLSDPRFSFPSLRRLEYIGDSINLDDQIAAVDRICELGPQLETFKFSWHSGNFASFLDVTKFLKIAKRTSALRYAQIIGVDKNIFEEFISGGLDRKVWSNLRALVWVPIVPWTVVNTIDTLSSDGRSIITFPRRHKISTISDTSNRSSLLNVDRDFRIHRISREMIDTFPSVEMFAIWNWTREGYDVMGRKSMSWTYGVTLDEDEWTNA